MIAFLLNNQTIQTEVSPGTTVLDFIRYHQHLMGTKIGCREGDCGACTVLVGELYDGRLRYRSMTSCLMPLGNAEGKHIVTVEGLNMHTLSPVQQAIVEEGGSQCGFCTVGFVMSLTGFTLQEHSGPILPDEAVAAMDGNICRCTGYKSLERAATTIAHEISTIPEGDKLPWLVNNHFLPSYFLEIQDRLSTLGQSVEQPAANGTGIYVGGGTDLFVQRPEEMVGATLQRVFDQQDMKEIQEKDGDCFIGGAATATDLKESPLMQSIFPGLPAHMKLVSSTPIRNMGTLGGNLVNASPIGDLTIFFLALNSHLVLNNNGQHRTLPLREFYLGYKKLDKNPGEFIESLFFKIPAPGDHFNFEKVCKRTHLDIASVNSACLLKMDGKVIQEAHLSAGGVGPIPMYLPKTAAALQGQALHPDLLKNAAAVIQEEISPISDARGTAAYKRLLLRQLFYGHFLEMDPARLKLAELV